MLEKHRKEQAEPSDNNSMSNINCGGPRVKLTVIQRTLSVSGYLISGHVQGKREELELVDDVSSDRFQCRSWIVRAGEKKTPTWAIQQPAAQLAAYDESEFEKHIEAQKYDGRL